MKRILLALIAILSPRLSTAKAQSKFDASHISGFITPYYNSSGPAIDAGHFSSGLASQSEREFLATIAKMKREWDNLTFPELYVGSIRLYDLGYRKEAAYWFYTANYRGRQFAMLLDESKIGGIGDASFELKEAQNAFSTIVGPYIDGYAFSDPGGAAAIISKVQKEGRNIPNLQAIYPGVTFQDKSEWKRANASLADGMDQLIEITRNKDELKRQRAASGADARFSHLTSKDLPRQE